MTGLGGDLTALTDALDVGVIVWSAERELRYVNQTALKILGVSREQLEDRGLHSRAWGVVGADGEPLPIEQRPVDLAINTRQAVRHAPVGIIRGDVRQWMLVTAVPRFEGDKLIDFVATLTDFSSERARFDALAALHRDVEAALDLSEAAYASAVSAMHEGIVIHEASGAIQSVNAAAERILGLSEAQLKGVEAIDESWALTDEEGQPLPPEQIPSEITARTGRPCRDRVLGVRRGGSRAWLKVSTAPLPSRGLHNDGRVPVVASFVDITAELRQQDHLRLAHRREAMGDVASGIAHHFNNMLAVIVPNIEMVLGRVTGEDAEALDDALEAATTAAAVVRQLLSLNRVDGGREHTHIDAAAETVRIVDLCKNLFDRRIEVRRQGIEEGAFVRVPPGQLQQAILQLCLNARDALDGRPSPEINVGVEVSAQEVVIRVGDNGVGIAAEAQQHLGEPFFTTKPVGQGTGLGLAHVYATVRDAGGEVRCRSAQGEGTTFELRLPRTEWDGDRPSSSPAPAKKRILLVDDERMVRSTMRRLLRLECYAVAEASSGDEALSQLVSSEAAFDVIVLDLSMPGMPIAQLLEALKVHAADVDLVVLSGYIRPELDLSQAKLILEKPVRAEQFLASLSSLAAD
jgi:two-component system cell cycle sensor histidine kinase/response regulator CckA